VDGRRLGVTGADGTLLATDVASGRHSVNVRKSGFRQVIADQNFTAGGTTSMEATMQSAIGNVRIEVSPAGLAAHLTIRREGEDAAKAIAEGQAPLNEGQYTIAASAPGYQDASQTVRVSGGQTATAALVLKPVAAKVEKPRGIGLADWEKAGGWEKDGASLTRRGGGIAFAPSAGEAGHYAFSVKVIKGKRVEWLVNYVDERNNVLFQLDDEHLTTVSVIDGSKKTTKMQIHVNREESVAVVMDVTDSSVSVTVSQQDKKFPESISIAHAAGKFGFRVPGKDEIELSEFHFAPR
jgi:hypothetical protein